MTISLPVLQEFSHELTSSWISCVTQKMADVAALEAQVKDAGEAVRLMKEANKAAPGTHSKV